MTLLDAALQLLRERDVAMTATELAAAAVDAELVAKATPAQIKALADKLAKLAAAGDRIAAAGGDAFVASAEKKTARSAPKKKSPAKKKPAAKARTRGKTKPPPLDETRDDESDDAIPVAVSDPDIVIPVDDLDLDDDEDDDDAVALEGFAEAPGTDDAVEVTGDEPLASDDEDVVNQAIVDEIAPPLSAEDAALAEIYQDEMGAPATAHGEYTDARTRDEDRPMLPEINAREERQKKWQEHRAREKQERRERREQREQRERDQGQRQPQSAQPPQQRGGDGRGQPTAQPQPQPQRVHVEPLATRIDAGVNRVGTSLGDAAMQLFAQLRNAQPLPVRQLAAMMRKRGLIEADPEQVWPHLKAALIGDERSYRALGLRPRIVYRGRDLFAPGPVTMASTANAETSLAAALGGLAMATHAALRERISHAAPSGFERIIHAYLVAVGYRDIDWVKRIGGISYATALPPDADRKVMISARSGDEPVDRRGIGELRVGVEMKDLLMGILFAPRGLSEDAQRELEKPGRSISVLVGDGLVAALIGAGIGVVSAAAPIRYVDDQLLDELLAG